MASPRFAIARKGRALARYGEIRGGPYSFRLLRAFPNNVDTVMRGLVPRIHVFLVAVQGVDGRDTRAFTAVF
jgi:hypothetical protein